MTDLLRRDAGDAAARPWQSSQSSVASLLTARRYLSSTRKAR
jgi:hypothetical protein